MDKKYALLGLAVLAAVFLITFFSEHEYSAREMLCKTSLPFQGYWEAETPNISVKYWHTDNLAEYRVRFRYADRNSSHEKYIDYIEIFDKRKGKDERYYITQSQCIKDTADSAEPYFNPFEFTQCIGRDGISIRNTSSSANDTDFSIPGECKERAELERILEGI